MFQNSLGPAAPAMPDRLPAMFYNPPHRLPRPRYSPARAWEPLSDDEWAVLFPFVHRHAGAGRPVRNPRARLDAFFWLAAQPCRALPPWAALPSAFGKPDTVSRQFRRWAAAGLWTRLLEALADPDRPASPCSAAWSPGSAAHTAARGPCSASPARRSPGASASCPPSAARPDTCPTPICPNG